MKNKNTQKLTLAAMVAAAAFCPWTWPPSSGRDGRCCGAS